MPHYKDWSSNIVEYPGDSGEYWGSFDSAEDLASGATVVDWSMHDANNEPAALGQNLLLNFWDDNNATYPEAFAIMFDPAYTTHAETDFMVWDISWSGVGGDISGPRINTMSLDELVNESNVQTTSFSSIGSIYFQFDSVPSPVPEPSAGLLLGLALGGSMLLRSVQRLLRLSSGILFVFLFI
jgi:hypothetical protein